MPISPTDAQIELEQQLRFRNRWNTQNRIGDWKLPDVNARQAQMTKAWFAVLERADLDILEVGCGSGCHSEQLVEFGVVTGTDLAKEVLPPTKVSPWGPGQIRKWVGAGELRRLLSPCFEIRALTSIVPVGDQGILRWINAQRLNRALLLFASQERIDSMKERLLLGHTLMALARKPYPRSSD